MQSLDTFHTHAHEENSNFFVLEEFWGADDEFQAQGHCLRKANFSHRRNPIFTEESKELPCVGPAHDRFDTSTTLLDTFCRELFHHNLFHTPMESYTHEDDNWMKGFFVLIPSKEQEVPTLIHGDLLREPPPYNP